MPPLGGEENGGFTISIVKKRERERERERSKKLSVQLFCPYSRYLFTFPPVLTGFPFVPLSGAPAQDRHFRAPVIQHRIPHKTAEIKGGGNLRREPDPDPT